MEYLDPNRPPPQLLGEGLDAIMDKSRRFSAPDRRAREQRYSDALCYAGETEDHGKREVHGAELQDNLRAYGTSIDLRLLAQAMYRMEMAQRALAQKPGSAVVRFGPTRRSKDAPRG